jgi:hypothetical protein
LTLLLGRECLGCASVPEDTSKSLGGFDTASRRNDHRMRWPPLIVTVAYLALAGLTAMALAATGVVDCYEDCRYDIAHPAWRYDTSAWQWTAMFWLGVCSLVASITFVLTAWRFRPAVASPALAVNLASTTAGGLLVYDKGGLSALGLVLILGGLAALGSVLIVTRQRLNARPLRSRGGAN